MWVRRALHSRKRRLPARAEEAAAAEEDPPVRFKAMLLSNRAEASFQLFDASQPRQASRHFQRDTAEAAEGLHVRLYGMVSDKALAVLAIIVVPMITA